MANQNFRVIDKFFDAFSRHDLSALENVLSIDATWTFPGRNPLSGTKIGTEEIIAFFEQMGGIMAKSEVEVERIVTGVNDEYVMECQHIRTKSDTGYNLNQHLCVLWTFKSGKIVEGKHLTSNPTELDAFFNEVGK